MTTYCLAKKIIFKQSQSKRCELEGDLRHSHCSLSKTGRQAPPCPVTLTSSESNTLLIPSPAPHRNALSLVISKQKIKQVDTARLETTLLGFYSNNNSEQ